ncbi:MAG: hypothetical protein EZS28_020262, partial [Streblomastix strix]
METSFQRQTREKGIKKEKKDILDASCVRDKSLNAEVPQNEDYEVLASAFESSYNDPETIERLMK